MKKILFGTFKLHSYITGDPLGDINYIVENKKGIVLIEPVAFYDNIKEINTYIEKLGKPVVKVISNYHVVGYSGFDKSKYVMVEGMPEFSEGQVYGGMMSHFANVFKEYLNKMLALRSSESTKERFVAAMKNAYTNLQGEENLVALSENLYN